MKKELIEIEVELKELYYYEDGKRIVVDRSKSNPEHITGYTDNIYGDMSGISGYVEDIRGDVSGIRGRISSRDIYGDVSNISGDVSNIYGNASNIIGNIDDCRITEKEREKRVYIDDLVKLKVGKNKITKIEKYKEKKGLGIHRKKTKKVNLSELAGMCGGKGGGLSFGGRDVRIVDGKKKVYYSGSQQEADDGKCWVVDRTTSPTAMCGTQKIRKIKEKRKPKVGKK